MIPFNGGPFDGGGMEDRGQEIGLDVCFSSDPGRFVLYVIEEQGGKRVYQFYAYVERPLESNERFCDFGFHIYAPGINGDDELCEDCKRMYENAMRFEDDEDTFDSDMRLEDMIRSGQLTEPEEPTDEELF